MGNTWDIAAESLKQIQITAHPNNAPVTIDGHADDLRCIGVGTDAAVFQSLQTPEYAFKVYAEQKTDKIAVEQSVYEKIGDSTYFSKCHAANDRYLVLSYESGVTLYDCLLQGIHIPEQVIEDVEDARGFVRNIGLNPRDIHLKNILLQDGRAKILDVSEYVQPGNDYRWEHLKKAYDDYYHHIDGKAIPYWLLETIRKWYNQWNKYSTTYDEFMKNVIKQIMFKK